MANTRSKSIAKNVHGLNEWYEAACTDYYNLSHTLIDLIKNIRQDGTVKETSVRADGYQVYEYNDLSALKKIDDVSGLEYWKIEDDDGAIEIRHDPNTTAYTLEFKPFNYEPDSDVGTNGSTIVKILEENDYDYLKTEDLMGVGLEMIDTLKFDSIIENYYPDNLETRELFQLWLEDRTAQYRKDIFEQCKIDIDEVERLRAEEKHDELDKYFNSRIEIASGLNDQLLAELAESLREFDPKNKIIPFKKVVKDIKQASIDNISKRGRPNIIKFKTIGKEGKKVKMMSAQFTQGKKTLPSSSRNRKLGDKKLLSNHVQDITGQIVETKNGPEVKVDTTITNHSSNPPIKESDELKRRYLAYLSVEEEVLQHVTNITKSMNSIDEVEDKIIIPISTMMMLTPIIHKNIEKFRGSTSENAQLGDTFLAYQMMMHNQPIKRKVMVNGKEKEVSIYVDLNLMNMPVNVGGLKSAIIRTKLQQRINNKGFEKYIEDVKQHIAENKHSFRASVIAELKKLKISDDEINDIYFKFNKKIEDYDKAINNETVVNLADQLKKLKENYDPELKKYYPIMITALKTYTETNDENAKAIYEDARKKIKKIDAKINEKEQELNEAKATAFKNVENIEAKELNDSIDDLLEKATDPNIREHLLLQKRFLLAQRLFYKEEYLDTQNAYRFHVLFLLTNEEINRFIVAFCKSGKDRTGWIRVALLASMAFYHAYGRDANFDNPKEKEDYNRFYGAAAMELSASLDATAQNGGGRGFQIGADFTNTYINAESGKYSGSLTKASYSNVLKSTEHITINNVFNLKKAQEDYGRQITKPIINVYPNSIKYFISHNRPDFDYSLHQVHNLIKFLREIEFDYSIQKNGVTYLVKDNREHDRYHPVPANEAEVQALRYLQGMLLIHDNLNEPLKSKFLEAIKANYQHFLDELGTPPQHSAKQTEALCHQFSSVIERVLNVKKGDKQLTMARDLGILLESHPGVSTISDLEMGVTVETSTPIKISEDYYKKHFTHIASQPWFMNAKKIAGYSQDDTDTWLEKFFVNNYDQLKSLGVPATPSSRWLPLPANNQSIKTEVARKDKNDNLLISESSFVRMGIVSAYDIQETSERKALAKDQIREIILNQIEQRILNYKDRYGDVMSHDKTFFVNYQTLLTPHKKEAHIPYKDNNARFVEMAKEVINELKEDSDFIDDIKNKYGLNLKFYQTNSSINHRGDWITAKDFHEDETIRREKIAAARAWAPLLSQPISDELKHEIERRIAASNALEKLLDNDPPFNNLNPYQRNIMMAALEFHVSGNQCLTLAGCKSARDRTAIFAAAVKVMQENRSAMMDWDTLNEGIILSLKQGHHFRSLIHHSAVVKVSDVHKSFMKALPIDIQQDIRDLKIFSKLISKYDVKEYKENWDQIKSRIDQYDAKIKTLTSSVLTKEQRIKLLDLKTHCEALRKQLESAQKRLETESPDRSQSMEYDQYLSKLDAVIKKQGKIAIQTHPHTASITEGKSVEEQVQTIIQNNDILNPTRGHLKDAPEERERPDDLAAPKDKLIHSCNKYIVGSHLITTVAVSSDNGHTRTIYFDDKDIKYLMGKNHFQNRNQDAKLKLLFECIDQVEKFRQQYAEGIINDLRKKGWPEEQINREGKEIVAQKLNELTIEIVGLPAEMAKKMTTYCALKGYSHTNLVTGKNGKYFNADSKDTNKMQTKIDANKAFLPRVFEPDNLFKNKDRLAMGRSFLGDMTEKRGRAATDAPVILSTKPIKTRS